jgi:hypothetical protein
MRRPALWTPRASKRRWPVPSLARDGGRCPRSVRAAPEPSSLTKARLQTPRPVCPPGRASRGTRHDRRDTHPPPRGQVSRGLCGIGLTLTSRPRSVPHRADEPASRSRSVASVAVPYQSSGHKSGVRGFCSVPTGDGAYLLNQSNSASGGHHLRSSSGVPGACCEAERARRRTEPAPHLQAKCIAMRRLELGKVHAG